MPHPVRIYNKHPDDGGRVVRVITSESLEQRSDAALKMEGQTGGYSSNFIPREMVCPECGISFWNNLRSKIYCSNGEEPYCSRVAFRKQSKQRQREKREKRKKSRLK